MSRKRLSVRDLAQEAGLDVDEVLIALWDDGFPQLSGPSDILDRGEANRARRALGLATRRELASLHYWSDQLGIPDSDLPAFLISIGVPKYLEGGSLTKRAIHRLTAERRARRQLRPPPATSQPTAEPPPGLQPLIWRAIGHERAISPIALANVVAIHEALVDDFARSADPIEPPGVRSEDLLASAVARPSTALDSTPKYPTVEMAAAALLHGIVHNHPFHNGNKRTGLVAMLVFLDENGLVLTCDEDALFKLVLQLAQHAVVQGPRGELADREVLHVAEWLRRHTRWVEKGDRAIPWRRLKRLLADYECSFEVPSTVGNRINIARDVRIPGSFFRRERTHTLRTQVAYGDDGREVDKGTINKIRHDLALDDDHGVDSKAFYDKIPMSPSDFIIRYRKTLRRLAKV